MRAWIIFLICCLMAYAAVVGFTYMKFDTTVAVQAKYGPFSGLSLKLIDYQVSYNDMHVKNDFWQSRLGQKIFRKLSIGLQTLVIASKEYVDVQFEVNYAGLLRRHYQVRHINDQFELVAV